jgi:hypothetical protein
MDIMGFIIQETQKMKLQFKEIKGRNVKIIYQDPNASKDFLELHVDKDKNPITIVKDKIDQFILPYELE